MATKPIHNRLDFLSPLSLVPQCGPKRVAALAQEGLCTIGDLLYYFPRRYLDRSTITPISQAPTFVNQHCTVIGTITQTRLEPGRRKRLRILVEDESGSMEALWFSGVAFYRASLKSGMHILMSGKVSVYGKAQMVHPQIETISQGCTGPAVPFLPQYRITLPLKDAGIGQKHLFAAIQWCLKQLKHYPQILPPALEQKNLFPPLQLCLQQLHAPDNPRDLDRFSARITYEELYTIARTLRLNRTRFAKPGRSLPRAGLCERFAKSLPFSLTPGQRKAIATLWQDSLAPQRMHRLLQGDVGCGKTVVAAMALLPALDNGLQAAWMTPTEVLAWQSFTTLEQWFAPLGVKVVLLKGGMEAGQRRALLGQIGRGEFQLVVGTQALLQPDVRFRRLGMVVIDEQHRFGVAQRQALEHKDEAADFLLMSATPIPQSLAQTLYGDLELVTIKDRPRGSQQISTHLVPEAKREDMYRFVREQLAGSGSAFYVTPRIERDDEEEESELKDVLSSFEQLSRSHFKAIPAALLHGRLSSAEKAACIGQFIEGAIRLLVATTVIEVGIDAPRASIIIIENADRFGLAQLHQLRGRVGRGGQAAWCFLLGGGGDNAEAQQRLRGFCSNHDGFALAELDLRLRGPGAILGRDQSGFGDVHLASILDDIELFGQIQRDLELLLPAEKVSKRSADPTMQG